MQIETVTRITMSLDELAYEILKFVQESGQLPEELEEELPESLCSPGKERVVDLILNCMMNKEANRTIVPSVGYKEASKVIEVGFEIVSGPTVDNDNDVCVVVKKTEYSVILKADKEIIKGTMLDVAAEKMKESGKGQLALTIDVDETVLTYCEDYFTLECR